SRMSWSASLWDSRGRLSHGRGPRGAPSPLVVAGLPEWQVGLFGADRITGTGGPPSPAGGPDVPGGSSGTVSPTPPSGSRGGPPMARRSGTPRGTGTPPAPVDRRPGP